MITHTMFRTAAAAAILVLLAVTAASSAELNSDPAAVRAQMLSVCEALKPRGGSCGARKPAGNNEAAAMSSAAGPAGDAPSPPPAKPVDAWGKPLQISIDNGSLRLQSAGADGAMNTGDDVVERCPIE